MKLPIKKKWFDMIKKGDKEIEWRDAHITFVCEETGETLRREITSAIILDKSIIKCEEDFTNKDLNELFEDDKLIGFALKESSPYDAKKDCLNCVHRKICAFTELVSATKCLNYKRSPS